ncbi:HsdM family class I SAM-dependent methyltransferase [Actinokineospora sp. 24-640]
MPALEFKAGNQTSHGQVFTRRWVVELILDLVGYTSDRDLSSMRLVEPSCGSGGFLTVAVERLIQSWNGEVPSTSLLRSTIRAFDLMPENVARARKSVERLLIESGLLAKDAQDLTEQWIYQSDYLLSGDPSLFNEDPEQVADFVVGNPPYIRLEDIPEARTKSYRARWPTMSGRADIYVGFYERALRSLAPDGRLGFICADRWMRNQYGAALRELVAREFSVDAVWTMHDVDAFESTVSAYPAITILSARAQGPVLVAETDAEFDQESAGQLKRWTATEEMSTRGDGFHAHRLPHWFPGTEMWPSGTPERIALIEYLNDNFDPLEDTRHGTRVGIGVATGADRIFLTHDDQAVEEDRLLPISMASDTRSGTFQWGGRYLVNPWSDEGSLVDLREYPRLRAYFARHRSDLDKRHTAQQNPTRWYKTIDKVNNSLISRSKLLIQDMRTSINPVLEKGGHYPHHNLYYVVSNKWDMEVLGGLLLSRIAQAFIEAYSVRMRGNTLRFQSQYLRKIRVPAPDSISPEVEDRLRHAFIERDVAAATAAAREAYKIDTDVRL